MVIFADAELRFISELLAAEIFGPLNDPCAVPASALEAYKTTSPWNEFGTIVPIEEEPQTAQYCF